MRGVARSPTVGSVGFPSHGVLFVSEPVVCAVRPAFESALALCARAVRARWFVVFMPSRQTWMFVEPPAWMRSATAQEAPERMVWMCVGTRATPPTGLISAPGRRCAPEGAPPR